MSGIDLFSASLSLQKNQLCLAYIGNFLSHNAATA